MQKKKAEHWIGFVAGLVSAVAFSIQTIIVERKLGFSYRESQPGGAYVAYFQGALWILIVSAIIGSMAYFVARMVKLKFF